MNDPQVRFDFSFPRQKPQFYAQRASDLVTASRYYAFGRKRTPVELSALEWILRTPGLRKLVVSRRAFELPHSQETWFKFRRVIEHTVPTASIVVYQSQWRAERYAAMAISGSDEVVGFSQIRPAKMHYRLPRRGIWHFSVPEQLAEVGFDGWMMRVFEPMPAHHIAVPWDAALISKVSSDVSAALEGVLEGVPPRDWVAAHGDLTPWNLRMDEERRLWLIDWEQAMWAPRSADLLRYLVTYGSLEGDTPGTLYERVVSELGAGPDVAEAAAFWLDHEFYADAATALREQTVDGEEKAESLGSETQIQVLFRLTEDRHQGE